MTELDIEKERREFEAWLDEGHHSGCNGSMYKAWLAAKRAVLGSAEPVAWVLTEELAKRETTYKAHLWFSDPVNSAWTAVYTEPQPQLNAEPVAVVGDVFTLHWIGSGPIAPLIERHGIKVGTKLYTAPPAPVSAEPDELDHGDTVKRVQELLGFEAPGYVDPDVIVLRINQLKSAPPSTDAKDSYLLDALKIAEAALSDIGDATREPGDDIAWLEQRAAKDLPQIRAAIAAKERP